MSRILIRATLVVAMLSAAGAALAGDVYQWKDAKGVMHYAENPPKDHAYQQRDVSARDAQPASSATTGAGTATVGGKPVAIAAAGGMSPQCVTAQRNLELLQGKGALQQDTDGDGKPDKTLDDAERANQMELARATLKANCSLPASKP